MSRPKFPRCILTVGAISRIVENQEAYDNDPDKSERD